MRPTTASLGLLAMLVACGDDGTSAGGGEGGQGGGDGGSGGGPTICSDEGAWEHLGDSEVGRHAPAVFALADGRVVVAAGWDDQDGVQSSAILFDPEDASLSEIDPANRARSFPVIVETDAGWLLAGGFHDTLGSVAYRERFDPVRNVFVELPPMIEARELHAATMLPDGRVLVTGGSSAVGLEVHASAELFDPDTGDDAATGDLVEARFGHATIWIDAVGKVLVAGGKGIGPDGDEPRTSLEWWDPETETFSTAGELQASRDRATLHFLSDGRILIVGGANAEEGPLETTEIFDPIQGTVEAGPSMNVSRMAHAAAALADGSFIVSGGYSDATDPPGSTASVERFDPATMEFVELPALFEARHDHGMVSNGPCSAVVAGGLDARASGATTPKGIERIALAIPK